MWTELEQVLGPIPKPYRSRLIEAKYPGIVPDAPPYPACLMQTLQDVEDEKGKRMESSRTEDMLSYMLSLDTNYYMHPDWDTKKHRLSPKPGRGWCALPDAGESSDGVTGTDSDGRAAEDYVLQDTEKSVTAQQETEESEPNAPTTMAEEEEEEDEDKQQGTEELEPMAPTTMAEDEDREDSDDDKSMEQPVGITRQLDPAAVPGAVDLLK